MTYWCKRSTAMEAMFSLFMANSRPAEAWKRKKSSEESWPGNIQSWGSKTMRGKRLIGFCEWFSSNRQPTISRMRACCSKCSKR